MPLEPQERDQLNRIEGALGEVSGKLAAYQETHDRDVRAVHRRVDEVKADLRRDLADVEKRTCRKVKRVAEASGTGPRSRAVQGATGAAGGAVATACIVLIEWIRSRVLSGG